MIFARPYTTCFLVPNVSRKTKRERANSLSPKWSEWPSSVPIWRNLKGGSSCAKIYARDHRPCFGPAICLTSHLPSPRPKYIGQVHTLHFLSYSSRGTLTPLLDYTASGGSHWPTTSSISKVCLPPMYPVSHTTSDIRRVVVSKLSVLYFVVFLFFNHTDTWWRSGSDGDPSPRAGGPQVLLVSIYYFRYLGTCLGTQHIASTTDGAVSTRVTPGCQAKH